MKNFKLINDYKNKAEKAINKANNKANNKTVANKLKKLLDVVLKEKNKAVATEQLHKDLKNTLNELNETSTTRNETEVVDNNVETTSSGEQNKPPQSHSVAANNI